MGLVANYGSDSDAGSGSESEPDEPAPVPAPVPKPALEPVVSGSTGATLFSKLAAPKNKKKRVIQLFTPLNKEALLADDEVCKLFVGVSLSYVQNIARRANLLQTDVMYCKPLSGNTWENSDCGWLIRLSHRLA